MKQRVRNRIKYAKADPLRYLAVPRRQRLLADEGADAAADGPDTFDRAAVRANRKVVPPESLQA